MKTKKTIIDNDELNQYKSGYLIRMLYGILMGLSHVIPGYSGGTTLTLIGFYESLITKIKQVFTDFKKAWWKNVLWLLPFLIFWVLALLGFSQLANLVAKANYQFLLVLSFALFTFLAIPTFVIVNKPDLIKIENKQFKIAQKNHWSIALFIIGFILILTIGLVIFFQGGIILDGNDIEIDKHPSITWIPIILSGILTGFVMLVPGISGSLILFLTNTYDDFYFGILSDPFNNLGILALIILASLTGLTLNIVLTSFLLKKYKQKYLSFCFGMISASFITILLAGKTYLQQMSNLDSIAITITVFTIIVVILMNYFLFKFSWKKRLMQQVH